MNFTVSRKKARDLSAAQGDSVRLLSLQWEEIYFEQLRPDLDCETTSDARVFMTNTEKNPSIIWTVC